MTPIPAQLTAAELRELCLAAGADDVGFVSVERPEIDVDRPFLQRVFPATRTLISIVCRMNVEPTRSLERSVANLEFHETGHEVNHVARKIVRELARRGIRALNPPMAFPMEQESPLGRTWVISHKLLAVAAGMGQMGLHRNVIHPRFGNFILLGAVLVAADIDTQDRAIDYNPCMNCKLCVAACPVGAISPTGDFNLPSCYTHNYREFMGGFTDWVETIAESRNAREYRDRVSDSETVSMWQSLSYGANYKAAYCLAVCPAGEEVIAPFVADRAQYLKDVVKPFQQKEETIYVQPESDAEAYVRKRFPHKRVKRVGKVLRPSSIKGFLATMRHGFQPGKAKGLDAVYHFTFTGAQSGEATVTIRDSRIEVGPGLVGQPDLAVQADGASWVRFLRGDVSVLRLLLTRKLKLKGSPKLLVAFGKCF